MKRLLRVSALCASLAMLGAVAPAYAGWDCPTDGSKRMCKFVCEKNEHACTGPREGSLICISNDAFPNNACPSLRAAVKNTNPISRRASAFMAIIRAAARTWTLGTANPAINTATIGMARPIMPTYMPTQPTKSPTNWIYAKAPAPYADPALNTYEKYCQENPDKCDKICEDDPVIIQTKEGSGSCVEWPRQCAVWKPDPITGGKSAETIYAECIADKDARYAAAWRDAAKKFDDEIAAIGTCPGKFSVGAITGLNFKDASLTCAFPIYKNTSSCQDLNKTGPCASLFQKAINAALKQLQAQDAANDRLHADDLKCESEKPAGYPNDFSKCETEVTHPPCGEE